MPKNFFKYAKIFVPLIGISILIYIIYSLDTQLIIKAFLSINLIYIVLALTLTIPRVLIRNYAWQLIQKEQKISISFWKSLKIFLIGYFYCSITPAYVGHLMRIPYLKKYTREPYGKLFINTIMEVTIKSISLYGMIFAGLLLIIDLSNEISYLLLYWSIFIIILVLFLFYFIKKERGEKLLLTLIKYLIPKKLKKNLNKFVITFYKDFPRIKKLVIPGLLGFVTWILIFTQEYMVVLALGLKIPYLHFIFLFPIANAIGILPVTFAGLGTREAAAIIIFTTLYTVSREEILIVSLIGFLITDIITGLVGFVMSLTEVKIKESSISKYI